MSFQEIVEELLARTGATRTTLRLDRPGEVFPVVAEALEGDARSIRGETAIDLRRAATFRYLERELRNLVQEDCAAGDYPAPPELIELYGVKAQMLGPVVREGRLAGILSVHYAPSRREWSETDVAALDEARGRVEALLPE